MANPLKGLLGDLLPAVRTPPYVAAKNLPVAGGGMTPPPNWPGVPFKMPEPPPGGPPMGAGGMPAIPGGGGSTPPPAGGGGGPLGPPLRDWAPAGYLPPPKVEIDASGPGIHGGQIPPRWTPDQQMGVAGLGLGAIAAGTLTEGEQIEAQKEQIAAENGYADVEELNMDMHNAVRAEAMKQGADGEKELKAFDQMFANVDLLTVGLAMMANNDGSKSFGELLGGAMLLGMKSKQDKKSLEDKKKMVEREMQDRENQTKIKLLDVLKGSAPRSTGAVSGADMQAGADALNMIYPSLDLKKNQNGEWKTQDAALARQAAVILAEKRKELGRDLYIDERAQVLAADPNIQRFLQEESRMLGFSEGVGANDAAFESLQVPPSAIGGVTLTQAEQEEIQLAQELGTELSPALAAKVRLIQSQQGR